MLGLPLDESQATTGCVRMDPRTPSHRPTVLVDQRAWPTIDPERQRIGRRGPFGRERIVSCLPFGEGPKQLVIPALLSDAQGRYVVDSDGAQVGRPGVWVSRMLSARWVSDTRRLT